VRRGLGVMGGGVVVCFEVILLFTQRERERETESTEKCNSKQSVPNFKPDAPGMNNKLFTATCNFAQRIRPLVWIVFICYALLAFWM